MNIFINQIIEEVKKKLLNEWMNETISGYKIPLAVSLGSYVRKSINNVRDQKTTLIENVWNVLKNVKNE